MPILKNPKHERFAQELAKGKTVTEAQEIAEIVLKPIRNLEPYYVYLLIDPRDDQVFYVGKGKGRRALNHEREWLRGKVLNPKKFERIGEIRKCGMSVRARCLVDGLGEREALRTELAVIRAIGWKAVVNRLIAATEEEKLLAIVKDEISRIRPYCRWRERIVPQLRNEISVEKIEAVYWDTNADLLELKATLEGEPFEHPRSMFLEIKKREKSRTAVNL